MWQGIQAITNYRTSPPVCDDEASFPDMLNQFYTQFDALNNAMTNEKNCKTNCMMHVLISISLPL